MTEWDFYSISKTMLSFISSLVTNPSRFMKDIILETKVWNTQENATFTLELIGDSLKTVPSLLITSASHMRRSLATFHQAGIPSDPYITDTPVQVGDQKPSWVPSLAVLLRWPELLHEWVGYAYYVWKGNI